MLELQTSSVGHEAMKLAPVQRNTSALKPYQKIYLNMAGGIIDIEMRGELTIGRSVDKNTPHKHIDLSSFGVSNSGISRQHIKLMKVNTGKIYVVDLWSTNGTYINDSKLEPYMMYPIDNGDVLRLGQFVIHVLFA